MLEARAGELDVELAALEERREPDRVRLEERRAAMAEAARARDAAADGVRVAAATFTGAQAGIERAEQEVERSRGDVYAVINTVTALTTAIEHAAAERERTAGLLARLDVEAADLRTELGRAVEARDRATRALQEAQSALHATLASKAAHEADLAAARGEHERRERAARQAEQDLAGQVARLGSLEEMDSARAAFGEGARMLLAGADDAVGQHGALADYLDVDPRYERAVEAVLGDLLQHVVVDHHAQAHAGFALVRSQGAGRCGFIVTGGPGPPRLPAPAILPPGAVRLLDVVQVSGPFASSLKAVIGDAVFVGSLDEAAALAATTELPVVTTEGDVYRGAHVVSGGTRSEARGILAIKREIKDLRETVSSGRDALAGLRDEIVRFDTAMAAAAAAVTATVGRRPSPREGDRLGRGRAAARHGRRGPGAPAVGAGRGRSQRGPRGDCRRGRPSGRTPRRRSPGWARSAERSRPRSGDAQRRLADARDHAQALSQRASEARAEHAGLAERAVATVAEVQRLEDAARELSDRAEACRRDVELMRTQRERLLEAAVDGQRLMDEGVRALEDLREEVLRADDETLVLKAATERQEQTIRDARRALDAVRALAAELDVSRATAEADLAHLAQQSLDAVQADLDAVAAEVAEMERQGIMAPDAGLIRRAVAEPDEDESDEVAGERAAATPADDAVAGLAAAAMTAEEAIVELRARIDRLGPVNMMAIQQFAELDGRRGFLTTQRQDLIDSIAQTNEAIRRIDETTHAGSATPSPPSTPTSSRPSPRCSAAAAPAWPCSTSRIRSRAASTSSPRRRASGCRA